MMKKFQLRGLRIPLQRRSKAGSADKCDAEDDIGGDSSEVRGNGGLALDSRQQGPGIEECGDDSATPRRDLTSQLENLEVNLPKKREKVGLFKTIRKRISTIHKKRDSASACTDVEDCDDGKAGERLDRKSRSGKHKTNSFKVSRPIQRPVRSSHSEECLDLSDDQIEEVWVERHAAERCRPDMKNISFGKDLHSLRSDYLKSREGAQISRSSSPMSSSRESKAPPTAPRPPLRSSKIGKDGKSKTAIQSDTVFDINPDYEQIKDVGGPMWSLTAEIFRLSKFGWYWGPITRVEAEEKLADQTDGAFLVRDSSDERYLLSLSFRSYGRTLHTRIEHCNGMFSFYAQPESEGYTSIVDLIEHSMTDSETGVFCYSRARMPGSPSFPVRLTKPVSRFTQVRSLQYLCRFVIRQYTRFDHIQKLPLPSRIIGWLSENQY